MKPGYWMHETSGVLRPAVMAYLNGEVLTAEHIGALRAYFRQWIAGPWAIPPEQHDALRRAVDFMDSRAAIEVWLNALEEFAIDPL